MSTCIFPGRFQPFHTGHLMVVKGIMSACGKAVIVICADPDGTAGGDAIFTNEEVREMISAALLEESIVDANIVVISDCEADEEWVDKILEAAGDPEEPVVWSGKEDVRTLFESRDIKTQKISEVPGISGEEIRNMIEAGNAKWREKIPAGAMDVVDKKVNP